METSDKGDLNLLNRLLNVANICILYLNKDGKILVCNHEFAELAGKQCCDIIGKSWLSVLFLDEKSAMKQKMFKAVIDASIAHNKPNTFEDIIEDSQGKERFISWSIKPVLSGDQQMEGILLLGSDLTESKEAEASLRKKEGVLTNIFSSIKEYALCVINLDGNITYYSSGAEKLFGWNKEEIIFKHASVFFTEEDAHTQLPMILKQVQTTGQFEFEMDLVKKDKQRLPVSLNANQLLDENGNLIGYIFIVKDITERKKLEYQIFQAQKLAAIGQLAAGIAHEINNPLFVISGRIELLSEEKELSQHLKDELKVINTHTDRIRKLMERVLKFARQSQLKLEKLNINEVIENVLPLLSYHKLAISNIEVVKDFATGLAPIKGDLNQLQEVFVNLCMNAYQSMPDGGRLSITTTTRNANVIEIRVSDTGCGIPKENLKNLFMPFFSTKKEGTGLGLSICYNIIKNHNGNIEVETEVSKGTTFIIRLPVAPQQN